MKVEVAIKEWLVECEIRGYTKKTLRGYKTNLNIFLRFCNENEIYNMNDIQMSTIKQYTREMIHGHKGTYVNSLLKSLKSFLQYIWDEYGVGVNTKEKKFKWVKEEKPFIKTFKPIDIKKILHGCKGNDYLDIRDTAIIVTLCETGIRCWELCCIKPSDVFEDHIVINGKNHKKRVVPISPIMKKALMKYDRVRESYFNYKNMEDYYFLSFNGRQLTNSGMEHMVKRRTKDLGIEGVRCSPHTFRHFFAQQTLKNGTDIYTLSRMLGHNDIAITSVYLRSLDNAELLELTKNNSVLSNLSF